MMNLQLDYVLGSSAFADLVKDVDAGRGVEGCKLGIGTV
jgi:hypothetical protein